MVSKMTMFQDLIEEVKDEVIGWRRYLHKYPELSFQEEKTAQFVYETLQSFRNLEISRPTKTSVMARLIGQQPGKIIALRADMDALPIEEENDFDFVSKNSGVMHACGHDGHTAMLLGTAKILTLLKHEIKGEVRFLFQHAEELFPGGAQEMVKAGVMKKVDNVIGIHLMSTIPLGKIGLTFGAMTAAADTFDITIQGNGGHASQPQETVDPIVIGSQVVSHLQNIVARNNDPLEKLVVSVTKIHGGSTYNVIPHSLTLSGSVRSFNPEIRKKVPLLIQRIVKGITEAHGASYHFDYHFGYSPTINEKEVTKAIEETVRDIFGEEYLLQMPPLMASEDFSALAKEAPGCFVFVGSGNVAKGIVYPHHHPRFTFDEEALERGVKLFVHSAFKLLGQ
ncbi:M20 family metallopeptidase [Alkalihalobacillus sp. BA299]|uniref:M20 family metallopeptidase n=1 Tax=Alkalihalobacillus sp. BA299 TaxID=2815938 RepID=UPI001ADC9D29|nr:M20 family metallopeptidase [Alkalihalobacillus sp. BA299]